MNRRQTDIPDAAESTLDVGEQTVGESTRSFAKSRNS